MRHVETALAKMAGNPATTFINVIATEGVPLTVTFTIQSDPIGEVGVNGCQAQDVLEFSKCLLESLNEVFPCRENALSITKLEEALHWQEARTKNRTTRAVEGKNQA